jgi:hypothetical protein
MHSALDKSIANSELAVIKQAADNYAAIQIKATKNKMYLEQKMLENTSDIKLSNIKDNNNTRTLINKLNNDNTRYDYQSEKIIHALHHHGGNDYHGFHNYYYNNDRHRGGGGGGGGD